MSTAEIHFFERTLNRREARTGRTRGESPEIDRAQIVIYSQLISTLTLQRDRLAFSSLAQSFLLLTSLESPVSFHSLSCIQTATLSKKI